MKIKISQKKPVSAETKLHQVEQKLNKTCDELEKLDHRVKMLLKKRQRAAQQGRMRSVASIDLEMGVTQSVYAMFHHYADHHAQYIYQCEQAARD